MVDTWTALGVSPGRAAGPLRRMAAAPGLPEPTPVSDSQAERDRAAEALQDLTQTLRQQADATSGEAADILKAQAMIVADPTLAHGIGERIDNGADAPHATYAAFAVTREALAAAGGVFAERVADLDDLRDRVTARLLGTPDPAVPVSQVPFVLAVADLAPADTAGLNADQVVAIVTAEGGPTSHTAILARAAGIPAVVGCRDILHVTDHTLVSVDGSTGRVESGIDSQTAQAIQTEAAQQQLPQTGPGLTSDAHPVPLLANIGAATDLPAAGACEGVGLFRTELLYLDRATPPSREEQRQAYRAVFEALPGQPVTVRTLDVGSDKPLTFIPTGPEPNPALGNRGFRRFRRDRELLDIQLRAIAEAAAETEASVGVMAPMVSTVAEARDFADRARAAGCPRVGVMIEVPAAALLADGIAAVVDFLSIGTNDLIQYTFAADRQNSELAYLLSGQHPALWELIERCSQAGTNHHIPVGVCGELAAEPDAAVILAGLGVTSLSMSPASIPRVREALGQRSFTACQQAAQQALAGE